MRSAGAPTARIPPLADPAARSAAHRLDEPCQREPAAEDQLGVERGEGRLVAEETRRGLLDGQLLLLRGVRRVVRRHEVEDAIAQGFARRRRGRPRA